MNTSREYIEVSGLRVEVIRKPIKNLHLSVHPPEGRVRVSAPQRIDDEAVRLAVVSRLRWIRRHQQRFADQPRQSKREMVSGESHYFRGRRYRLRVTEHNGPNRVSVNGTSELKMQVRTGTDRSKREQLLNDWYPPAHERTLAKPDFRLATSHRGKGLRLGHQEDEDPVG